MSALRAVPRAAAALALALGVAGAAIAQQQAPAALVRVDAVRIEPLSQTVPVIGRLVARQGGLVAARTEGPIERILVQVGDRVEKGDVIAMIEDLSLVATREQAAGRLAEARARIGTAEAQLGLARQERERLAALKNTQATSKALYEDALQNEAIAKARVREAQAAAGTAQANLRLAEIDLDHARVVAPYGGIVAQRLHEEGAYAKTGDAIVRMLADEGMEVEADVPFDRLGGLTAGAPVEVALDDATRLRATVRAVIPEENRLTRTRAVRFSVDLAGVSAPLADGQTATVQVPVGAPREVVSVHKDAINRRGEQTFVYVVTDDVAKLRPVRLGEAFGNRFEVLSGLEAGEQAVVRGNERLRPDDKVRIGNGPPGSAS